MTDITDQDRRDMREWASLYTGTNQNHTPLAKVARYILATVDAPAPTLAEDILDAAARIRDAVNPGDRDVSWADMESCADRAKQTEHDRDEARAELERERDLGVALAHERDDARAEVERLTAEVETEKRLRSPIPGATNLVNILPAQKAAESTAETPHPADVKPGEAWLIRIGEREAMANRNGTSDRWPWAVAFFDGESDDVTDKSITLVSRLVPAPRVITNPDELDQVKRRTVILSTDGQADVYQKDSNGEWVDVASYGYPSRQVIRMENAVTVLWEPGA